MPVMVSWSVGVWFDPWQGLISGLRSSSSGGSGSSDLQQRKVPDCWVGSLLDVVRTLHDGSTLSEANWHK